MLSEHFVSIVIPTFNREKLVIETINSVLRQTSSLWELIIVDDGSTDNTLNVLYQYEKEYENIRVFERPRRLAKGAAMCRNHGATNARGKYIIFLDSDDLLAPFCIQQRYEYISRHQTIDCAIFPMLIFEKEPYDTRLFYNVPTKEKDLYRFLRIDTLWQTTQPVWRKDSFLKVGGFDQGITVWDDLALNLKMLSRGLKYNWVYDVKPDCFLRSHMSERMTNDFSLGSLDSQKKVMVKALTYFSSDEQAKRNIKVMANLIIENGVLSKQYDWSYQLIEDSFKLKIFSKYEKFLLKVLVHLKKANLNQIRGFYRIQYLLLYQLKRRNMKWCRVRYGGS